MMVVCPAETYGSKVVIFEEIRRVSVPPYWGVPSESHQFPVAVVVVGGVVVGELVVVVVVVVVFVVTVVDVSGDVAVDVGDDVVQDASSIATTIKKLKPNQINLFFNRYLHFG
jgi:hypothetical protein